MPEVTSIAAADRRPRARTRSSQRQLELALSQESLYTKVAKVEPKAAAPGAAKERKASVGQTVLPARLPVSEIR